MTENPWRRTTVTVRERYRRSALAQYGASLDCECEVDPTDIALPLPRAAPDDRVAPAGPTAGARSQAAQVS